MAQNANVASRDKSHETTPTTNSRSYDQGTPVNLPPEVSERCRNCPWLGDDETGSFACEVTDAHA